jgi:type III restriction enzyme
MMRHYRETPTRYQAKVTRGFQLLTPLNFKVADPAAIRDFKVPVVPLSDTKRFIYSGFSKCAFPQQSFQSDEERRFAVLIDSAYEADVIRWVKPGPKQFQIEYRRAEKYEPDFVVETASEKLIVEVKARKDLEDETVKWKAEAARTWVGYANHHATSYGGKPWRYVMIPHDEIRENSTLSGLIARFSQAAITHEVSEQLSIPMAEASLSST